MKTFIISLMVCFNSFGISYGNKVNYTQPNKALLADTVRQQVKKISSDTVLIKTIIYNKPAIQKKIWIDWFTALLTPFIAVITVYIAFQQYKIQRYKVKYDLFERRLKLYEDLRAILVLANNENTVLTIDTKQLHTLLRHSRFLLKKSLAKYIEEISVQIVTLYTNLFNSRHNYKLFNKDEDIKKNYNDIQSGLLWINSNIEVFEEKFAEFMKMNKI